MCLASSHLVFCFENQFPHLLFKNSGCVSDVVGVFSAFQETVCGELSALELRKCSYELCDNSDVCYLNLRVSKCAHAHIFTPHRLIPNPKYFDENLIFFPRE